MFPSLPTTHKVFMDWTWEQIAPYYDELANREIDSANVEAWLSDWTGLIELLDERFNRLYVATTVDTNDQVAQDQFNVYLDEIYPKAEEAEQTLKEKLLNSGLEPPGFEIALRNLRAEAEIFRQENVPLLSQEIKLSTEYDKIIGAQTVSWEGEEVTLPQLTPIYQDTDRTCRERAWRLASNRQLADRDAINELWVKFMALRGKIAANAGFDDYRSYRWKQYLRFDYTPEDCYRYHAAVEKVAVPAMQRVLERRRQRLGLESLRPWDLDVDPFERPPLRPFKEINALERHVHSIFQQVDPQLGDYFQTMRQEKLLDLDNRKGKAPGGYCTEFAVIHRPFIFMNAVGIHDDVQTLLHEGGHAFHVFESAHLPYFQQTRAPMEFSEVASMAMELLSAPYLVEDTGGFYSEKDAARARIEYLEAAINFWPYNALVDAFQHWVYENHTLASNPASCDAKWVALWKRFMPGVNWEDLQEDMETGWHRKLHIHQVPFYYIEYGLAQLGAFQVWRNSLENQREAVQRYRNALSKGGSIGLPDLYQTAGARFAFDERTLSQAISLAEETIEALEQV